MEECVLECVCVYVSEVCEWRAEGGGREVATEANSLSQTRCQDPLSLSLRLGLSTSFSPSVGLSLSLSLSLDVLFIRM